MRTVHAPAKGGGDSFGLQTRCQCQSPSPINIVSWHSQGCLSCAVFQSVVLRFPSYLVSPLILPLPDVRDICLVGVKSKLCIGPKEHDGGGLLAWLPQMRRFSVFTRVTRGAIGITLLG